MALPVRVIVRTNADWRGMSAASLTEQTAEYKPTGALLALKRKGAPIPQWEEAYGLNYCEYRADLRDQCERQLKAIRGIDVTVGLSRKDEWAHGLRDEVLIPIDDDDLVFPKVRELGELIKGYGMVVWDRYTWLPFGDYTTLQPRNYLDSCNWAIRKSFLLDHWPEHIAADMLNSHQAANRYVLDLIHGKPPSVFNAVMTRGMAGLSSHQNRSRPLLAPFIHEVEGQYSCYYLHSGSISWLINKMPQKGDLVAFLRRLPLHPMYEAIQWRTG